MDIIKFALMLAGLYFIGTLVVPHIWEIGVDKGWWPKNPFQ